MTIHSIVYHTRLSHFLVTLDETVNNDMDQELEVPLSRIWEHCGITAADLEFLQAQLLYPNMWVLEYESENIAPRYGMPEKAGVYRSNSWLVVTSEYDDGSGSRAPALWSQVYNLARS